MSHSGPELARPADDRLVLSARLQRVVARRTERTDLVVRVTDSPTGDSQAWSACFRHDLAEVQLSADLVFTPPDAAVPSVDLGRERDRAAQPVLAGAACLAVAHATHTKWTIPTDVEPSLAATVDLLERTRVLRAHLRRHRSDRQWLRAAGRTLTPADPRLMDVAVVGLGACGLLDDPEVQPARDRLEARLGPADAAALSARVGAVGQLDDGAVDDLLQAAAEIVALLQLSDGADQDEDHARGEPAADNVLASVADTATRASQPAPHRPTTARLQKEVADAERRYAQAASQATFDSELFLPDVRYRAPDVALRAQARRLAGSLRRARYRAPSVTFVPSDLPPGFVRLSEAMRRQAQREAGAQVTARAWLQTRRRTVDQPPLRVGLSWDISRSQSPLHPRLADFAWALAWAMSQAGGRFAAVAWNGATFPVAWPGRVPSAVAEPPSWGTSSACPQSLRALDGSLSLRDGTGGRVVIIATDGKVTNRRAVQDEVRSLIDDGVIVFWATPGAMSRPLAGATVLNLANPAEAVVTLGSAVSQALLSTSS